MPEKTKTIIAKFVPQANADRKTIISVEPKGPDTFDVTAKIVSMGLEKALALRDDQYETDELREEPGVPAWIKDWDGPFYISVAASIAEFFEEA